jgi:hypothetical protein
MEWLWPAKPIDYSDLLVVPVDTDIGLDIKERTLKQLTCGKIMLKRSGDYFFLFRNFKTDSHWDALFGGRFVAKRKKDRNKKIKGKTRLELKAAYVKPYEE